MVAKGLMYMWKVWIVGHHEPVEVKMATDSPVFAQAAALEKIGRGSDRGAVFRRVERLENGVVIKAWGRL